MVRKSDYLQRLIFSNFYFLFFQILYALREQNG